MTTTVRVPTALRSLTGGADEVLCAGETVREVLGELERRFPGMRARLVDDKGVRRFVNLYVGDEDIRFLGGLATRLDGAAVISIVPAVAGG